MRELAGCTAVVTGAASGIGLAMARRFAAEGMSVVMADVEAAALDEAVANLPSAAEPVLSRVCDVRDPAAVAALAEAAEAMFGPVHVLCNNAGVAASGLTWEQSVADFEWVLGVNLWGVINGMHAFVPRMLSGGHEGHVVNTASMTGIAPGPAVGAYGASKAGVIALTESLQHDFAAAGSRLRAHVLVPSFTASRILESARNRPGAAPGPESTGRDDLGPDDAVRVAALASMAQAQSAEHVAAVVVDGLRHDRFWLIPDPRAMARVERRHREMRADAAAVSIEAI